MTRLFTKKGKQLATKYKKNIQYYYNQISVITTMRDFSPGKLRLLTATTMTKNNN